MSDEIIRSLDAYPWRRDYPALWRLAKRQGVICRVDSRSGFLLDPPLDPPLRVIGQTIWTGDGSLNIGVPGDSYIYTLPEEGLESFERQALAVNLEWLAAEPGPEKSS